MCLSISGEPATISAIEPRLRRAACGGTARATFWANLCTTEKSIRERLGGRTVSDWSHEPTTPDHHPDSPLRWRRLLHRRPGLRRQRRRADSADLPHRLFVRRVSHEELTRAPALSSARPGPDFPLGTGRRPRLGPT